MAETKAASKMVKAQLTQGEIARLDAKAARRGCDRDTIIMNALIEFLYWHTQVQLLRKSDGASEEFTGKEKGKK